MTTEEFRQEILLKIFGVESVEEVKTYELTDEDWKKSIESLRNIIEIGIGITGSLPISISLAKNVFLSVRLKSI